MKDMQNEIENNPVLSEVQNVLIEQTKKGIEKYGTTVQYQNLNAAEWIQHAKEETTDKLVYLTCLEKSIQLLEAKAKAFDAIHGLILDYHNAGTLNEELLIELVGDEMKKAFREVEG